MLAEAGGELPQFIRDMLAAPPQRGAGLHKWIFRIARHLHAHRSEGEIVQLLEAVLIDSGAKAGEVAEAVRNSKAVAWRPGRLGSVIPGKKWPAPDTKVRAEILKDGRGLVDAWEVSPIRMDADAPDTEHIIDKLFPGNPLLCCGWSMSKFETKPREQWRGGLASRQFIVPSPMSRPRGTKKDGGGESEHTLDNTGPRRFLVVEFDHGDADEHAAILLHLATRAPLAMIVHSGGKSLHGWFFCEGRNDETLKPFFEDAVRLGADDATWSRCQFVRMPGGVRETGNPQTVYFFNPDVIR